MDSVRLSWLGVCLIFAVLVSSVLIAGAHSPLPSQTPLPPRCSASVHDVADVIDERLEDSMERLNAELLETTGVALVVVTVPALVEETIDAFAIRVGERWGLGRRGDGRGIVVDLAKQSRRVFVATGYGVKQYLPEGRVGRLVDEYARPSFHIDDFGHGLYLLSEALAGASARELGSHLAAMPPIESRVQEHGRRLAVGLLLTCLAVVLALRYPALFFRLLVGAHGSKIGRPKAKRRGARHRQSLTMGTAPRNLEEPQTQPARTLGDD